MRALLLIALALTATPAHRRFMQPNLPTCSAATGSTVVSGSWADLVGVVANPVRTLNAGPSPGCDNSMLDLVLPATAGGVQFSAIANAALCPVSATVSYGVWVQGTSASGSTDICSLNGTWTCGTINFTTTAQWFPFQNVSYNAGTNLAIGNLTAVNSGTVARSAIDIKVWGARCVAGATITQ